MKEYKRQYKIKEEPPLKIEGKNSLGEVQKIQKTFLHDKKKKYGQGTHEALKIEDPEYQKLVERVYDELKQGYTSNEILANLLVEGNEMGEVKFLKLLKHAYQFGKNALQKDREYLFQLHMSRYEKIYQQCMTMQDSWHRPLDASKDWQVIVMKYKAAIKALKAKEDLLGLHDKSISIEFNDHKAILTEPDRLQGQYVSGFNLDELNNEDLIELSDLIKQSRTVSLEGVQRISVKKTKIEINIETGDREVNQVINIEKEIPLNKFNDMPDNIIDKFTNVTQDVEAEVIESKTNQLTTLDDLKYKLQQKVLKQLNK